MILIHLPISIILSIIVPIYPLVKLFKVGTNDMNSLGRVMNFPCLLGAEKKGGDGKIIVRKKIICLDACGLEV